MPEDNVQETPEKSESPQVSASGACPPKKKPASGGGAIIILVIGVIAVVAERSTPRRKHIWILQPWNKSAPWRRHRGGDAGALQKAHEALQSVGPGP